MNSPSFNRAALWFVCVILLNGFGRISQAQSSDGRLLNIDFAALTRMESLKSGLAAIGISTSDYWNLYRRSVDLADTAWRADGQMTNLLYADRSASTVGIAVTNAEGAWFTDSTDPMLRNYLYPLSRSGNIGVTLTGLPAGQYRLDVYAHGQPPQENASVRVSSANLPSWAGATSSAADWDAPTWKDGSQFVSFDGIEVRAGAPLVITISPGVSGLAVLNGLQLLSESGAVPLAWWQQFFGAGYAQDPRAIPTADPDGDGADNYQEFLSGTDPLNAQSVPTRPVAVSTYIGSDAGGQDGPRSVATLTSPSSLALDPNGQLWITESTFTSASSTSPGAHRVRMLDLDGVLHTMAGGTTPGDVDGPRLTARFNGPHKVAFDHYGNAYVADQLNNSIRKIDLALQVTTFAGGQPGFRDGQGTNALFNFPIWIVSDTSDNLYVADWNNYAIRKISPSGQVTTYAGGQPGDQDGPLASARFNSPNGLAFGPDGSLFVSDWLNGKIRRIKGGQVTTFASGPTFLDGINCDAQGNVYASFNAAGYMAKFNPDGTLGWTIPTGQGFQDGPIAFAKFSGAVGAPLPLPDGNLLVYDVFNNRVRKITMGVPPLLTIDPATSVFTNDVRVTLSTMVQNGVIHYTVDGSEPASTSAQYFGVLTVTNTTTIKARLFVDNEPVSGIVVGRYTRAGAPPSCVPAASGLVAWWPAEGSANDAVQGLPGFLEGEAKYVPGEVGQGFAFPGSGGHVRAPASGALDVGARGGLTIEGWLSPSELTAQRPIAEWNSGTRYGAHFYLSVIPPYGTGPGCVYANLVDTSGQDHVITSPPGLVQAGQFQHVAVTYDRASGQAGLYLNGNVVAQANLGSFVPQTSYDFYLGYRPPGFAGSPFAFAGQMDELSLYDRALSAGEIAAVQRAGQAGKCPPVPPVCPSAPAGLVGWWPGEGNAQDVAGGHNGTMTDGVTFQPGVVGEAFQFDGRSGRVVIPDAPDLNFGPGDNLSIEAWIKANPGSTNISSIFDKRDAPAVVDGQPVGGAVGYSLFLAGGRLGFQLGAAPLHALNHHDFIASGPDLRDGRFHHVSATVDRQGPSGGKLFVDGQIVLTFDASIAAGTLGNSQPARIGNHATPGFSGFFDGEIDELALYRRALADSEVESIYRAGAAGKCGLPPAAPAGLAAVWHFDETSGSVAHDAVGNLDGRLSSGARFVSGGISGNALQLDRTANGYVNFGDVLGELNTSFSVVAWVKMNAGDTAENSLILAKHESGYVNGYFLNVNQSGWRGAVNKAMFWAGDPSLTVPISTTDVNDGRWHQVVAVHELGGNDSLYVDGGPAEAQQAASSVVASPAPLLIGGASFSGILTGLFSGLIDEVQVYDRALQPGEVNALFHSPVVTPPRTGYVSTVAGSGQAGFQDGPALTASFQNPNGGVVGPDGGLYVADTYNNRIRRVDLQTGLVSTVAGSGAAGFQDGPALAAQFNHPLGTALDSHGNLFVADTSNNRIRVVHLGSNPSVTTLAGSGIRGYADGPATTAQFDFPNDLVVDATGNLFVSEFNNHTIRKITPDGTVSTFVGNGKSGFADGMGTAAGFNQPGGLAIDANGNLFVTEWTGNRVRKVTPSGLVFTVAGNGLPGFADGAGIQARFNEPDGIVVDAFGNLYVTEDGNHAVRRISPDGVVSTVAGTGAAGYQDGPVAVARFNNPGGIALDARGDLLVTDTLNQRIRKISLVKVASPVSFARSLPPYYAPGTTFTVSLKSTKAGMVGPATAYALQETPPTGWLVTQVGRDGVFDPVTGTVKFGPFFDLTPRSFTYQLTPPQNATGPAQFNGVISAAGNEFPIGGDSTIQPAPGHPADLNPADGRMVINELTRYAAAWQSGQSWSVDPNPIPISYVTRAGLLWQKGEWYRFDPSVSVAPLWWVPSAGPQTHVVSLPSSQSGAATNDVSRAICGTPAVFIPGEPFAITVELAPAGGVSAYAVEQPVPEDWTVDGISDDGQLDTTHHSIKWGPFFDDVPRKVSFTATASKAVLSYSVSGVASFDGVDLGYQGPGPIREAVRLNTLQLRSNGDVALQVGQPDGKLYRVEVSNNLVDWSLLATEPNPDGFLRFRDPDAQGQSQRFYRISTDAP